MMSKKLVWPSIILVFALLIVFFVFNIQIKNVDRQISGMYVNNFIIEDGKTIPSLINEQEVDLEVKLSLRKFFSNYQLNGEVTLDGITYNLLSSDIGTRGYIAAISSKSSQIEGHLKISEDLQHYSLSINDNDYLVAPAQSTVEAANVVHLLYGER